MWAMLSCWVMKVVKNEGGGRIWLVATLLTQLDDKKIVTFGYNHYVRKNVNSGQCMSFALHSLQVMMVVTVY